MRGVRSGAGSSARFPVGRYRIQGWQRIAVAVSLGFQAGLTVVRGDAPVPPAGAWERVRVKMEARGELFAPTGEGGGEIRRPFAASARFDFLEARFPTEPPNEAGEAESETTDGKPSAPRTARGVRYFFSAGSDLSIDGAVTRRSLGEETCLLLFASAPAVSHFAADSLLTREEVELLAIPFEPALLDRLVPPDRSVGGRLHPSPDLTAALLAIDTIGRPADEPADGPTTASGEPDTDAKVTDSATDGPLEVRLADGGDDKVAKKLVVEGTVHGAVDGVPTTIRVDGTYELDPDGTQVRSGIVRLREKRLAGHVSPGFECDATFQMARRPAEGSRATPVADEDVFDAMRSAWDRVGGGDCSERTGRLRFEDPGGRFTLAHDSRWRVVAEGGRGLVMRLVDEGALLAECTISPLPRGDGKTAPEDFRRDVERSLGEKLDRIRLTEEPSATGGKRVLRVVSDGRVEAVPLEWRHYLVEDADGSRTAVTFAVERRFSERFGEADAALIDGLVPEKHATP